ncbi:unnamed protein product [Thlaspi arvense]|uniref:MATH domain-containing protein n=1 Tax=Thlaspi arvense TaxID=13288 RepID=A0AAU9T738_THLAR|nr:unnamed protein product [Thlaspi arvense]
MNERKFTWVIRKISSWEDGTWDGETYYSSRFAVAGCAWRLSAYPSEYSNADYLSLYLELAPGSSPPGWTKNVQFTFSLMCNLWTNPIKVSGGQCCFDAKNNIWGFGKFLSLDKLRDERRGFLVNDSLVVVAEVKVFPATVLPLGPVSITALSQSCKEGYQASDAPVVKSQVAQETDENNVDDDDDASEESVDDDDTSEESSDDDASEESADDDDTSGEGSDDDASSPALDDEKDDAPKKDVDGEAASLVTSDNARNGTSLDQVKPFEENGEKGFNTVLASVAETSNDVLRQEIQPVKETMDVNGFVVLASQVESVKRIFERHPDIAADFRAKNQRMRQACMSFLLSLIETLCQSLEELSNEDLVEADIALTYLKDAGFKVDWLEKKLDQLKENKEKEKSGLARLQEIEESLAKLKLQWSLMDDLAEMEKAELSATRTALSFDDLV